MICLELGQRIVCIASSVLVSRERGDPFGPGLGPCMGLFPSRSLLAHGLDVLLAVELDLGRER